MKLWKLALVTTTLILSASVNAALINNGTYNTDTETGLDWLDLSVTFGQSYQHAIVINEGWRYASNAELENIFNQMFPGFIANKANGSYTYTSSEFLPRPAEHYLATDWSTVFGRQLDGPTGIHSSYGYYLDENNTLRILGVEHAGTNCFRITGGEIRCNFYTGIFGPEYDGDYLFETSLPTDPGVFLVRASVVPIPAAAWLFGCGLISLVGVARVKRHKIKSILNIDL